MAIFVHNKSNLSPEKAGKAALSYGSGDYDFYLEVEGKLAGVFSSLVGGGIEITVLTHDVVFETGDSTSFFIPAQTSFKPFTLTRGVIKDQLALYDWFGEASSGDIVQARRNGTVWMFGPQTAPGESGRIVYAQWNFENAWASKIDSFSYNAYTGSKAAKVSLTVVPEFIERVQ